MSTMDSFRESSWIVKHLKWKLAEIFEENVEDLFDELNSLDLVSLDKYLEFCSQDSPAEKSEELINLILQNGEAACEKFLNHLENLVLRFPDLSGLSWSFLEDRFKSFQEVVEQLDIKKHLNAKLTLGDVLSIGTDNLLIDQPQNIADIPWHFLTKIIGLNITARNIELQKQSSKEESDEEGEPFFSMDEVEEDPSCSIHPLDVLCALLHCSDPFLQQEIVTKMSLCQFAVPLLLPIGDGSRSTFMLWAMRDIVKKWRPQSLADSKGFSEDNVVNIEMPIFSFVRLGPNKLSKSKTLNQVLNPAQQHHEFFTHDNMEGGNIERKISDGLVEMSWYFPNGKSDVFSEPIAVANLRGDLESNWEQFTFLTRISSATFIFIESMCERQFRLLSSFAQSDTKFYLIVTPGPGKYVSLETQKLLKSLMANLKVYKKQFIEKRSKGNDAEYVKNIQSSIEQFLKEPRKKSSIENLKTERYGLHIDVDEDSSECQKARVCALNITSFIENVEAYKKMALKLQGDLWKKLSKIEKELCRMTNLEGKDVQQYQSELVEKRISLHKEQNGHDLSEGIMLFINAITHLSRAERQYFLKWMRMELESISRKNVSLLQAEFKEKCSNKSNNSEELKQIDQKISDSSLGIEHFLRELGQFYEAECSMVKQRFLPENTRQFSGLPEIASSLLLDGFPLELVDGDASNIPLQWITDVLTELDKKTGGQCRMRVITVLGVQSTGKSTLLNTMFGLQFPVASGRCTRGAFMNLLKVEENFQKELGCEFILVIDTEGLKAPELSSLDDSYEHDNELATLVVGLSDVTIVNIGMENTSEMKDILAIVLHAFLRMNDVGKKPNCQFVHQNVSDVSIADNAMIGRAQLFNELQEMIKVAAKMEKKDESIQFSDILDFDPQKHSWYIPGLWHGDPPMASVNIGYSETIFEFKKYMFTFMTETHDAGIHSIRSFAKWTNTLWQSIKYESFIFSFRNILAAEAYEQLCNKYSELEWGFRRQAYKLISKFENSLKNQSIESYHQGQLEQTLNKSMDQVLAKGENDMSSQLSIFFKTGSNNPHLIERYKQEFFNSVKGLRRELHNLISSKFAEAISIQKGKHNLNMVEKQYLQNVDNRLNSHMSKLAGLHDVRELEEKFESLWQSIIGELQPHKMEKLNVDSKMLRQLKDEMRNRGSNVSGMLNNVESLQQYEGKSFSVEDKHIDISILQKLVNLFRPNTAKVKLQNYASTIANLCQDYVTEKIKTGEDYSDMYCRELLNMINGHLEKQSGKLSYNHLFQVELKLHILGRAAPQFQQMHDQYRVNNNPIYQIRALKPKYFNILKTKIMQNNETKVRANYFCEQGLIPAITAYIYNNLGRQIIDDILKDADGAIFKSRKSFHYHLLAEMLDIDSFVKYNMYINNYKNNINRWIYLYILQKYKNTDILSKFIDKNLKSILKKIRFAIADTQTQPCENMSEFLKYFSLALKQDLVIPRMEMEMTAFQNNANICQFWQDTESFLSDIENQIRASLKSNSITFLLCNLTLQPQAALAAKVIGCDQECPFCHVPCEAETVDHRNHFATCHRPKGIAQYTWSETNTLCTSICTNDVISDDCFANPDTNGEWVPYKKYQMVYPQWTIEAAENNNSSDYWKFVLTRFNLEFAKLYDVEPAEIPEEWSRITKKHALHNLKAAYNVG